MYLFIKKTMHNLSNMSKKNMRMRVRLSWVPKVASFVLIISIFVSVNFLWTSRSSSTLTKRDSNSSKIALPYDEVTGANLYPNGTHALGWATDNKLPFYLTALQLGQLGNNMFQYASVLGLAKLNGLKPFFPLNSKVNQVFEVTNVADIKEARKWARLGEANHGKYESRYEHLPKSNLTLVAYLQSFKYFQHIAEYVKQEFHFKEGIERRAQIVIKSMAAKINGRTPIGVHVRRRDLLSVKEQKLGSLTAPKSYFVQAFEWMKAKHGSVVFLVATDDEEWCRQNIINDDDVILLPPTSGDVHMAVLVNCHHVIMTVGTFGWWAGWLGGGDVIYYTQQHMPGSWKNKRFNNSDFFPPSWIGIGDSPLANAGISNTDKEAAGNVSSTSPDVGGESPAAAPEGGAAGEKSSGGDGKDATGTAATGEAGQGASLKVTSELKSEGGATETKTGDGNGSPSNVGKELGDWVEG